VETCQTPTRPAARASSEIILQRLQHSGTEQAPGDKASIHHAGILFEEGMSALGAGRKFRLAGSWVGPPHHAFAVAQRTVCILSKTCAKTDMAKCI
jgi:hypothetical protein